MKQLLFFFLGFIVGAAVMYYSVQKRESHAEKALKQIGDITEQIMEEAEETTDEITQETERQVKEIERQAKKVEQEIMKPTRRAVGKMEESVESLQSNKVAQSGKNFKMFAKPGNCVGGSYFQVEKVMDKHYAIAQEQDYYDYTDTYLSKDLIVLFYSPEEHAFYDEQIIKIPKGKCARQLGLYNWKEYEYSDVKVIPIVQIMDK